ncbi:MAG: SPFH domain-containing protein [Bacteroidetes bacterium]|jgi:membrane protease subunit (stomatin/prohibitin family)|nr:SPFH domain-containing protein [Bacteroidota bacterium]
MAVIDLVKWDPQGSETLFAYKFPATNLSTYTQLLVQETQEAILFSKGRIVGKFGPGKYTLNTENLPILRNLFGLPFGQKNPFTAEVWFVNRILTFNIDWKIDRMDIHDADYNTGIPLIAKGTYGLRIEDAERFLIKIVGSKNVYNQHDLTDQFYGEFSSKTKSTLMQEMIANKIGIKQISAFLDYLSEKLRTLMIPFWENIGFDLTKFYITSIEVDGTTVEGKRILEAISRQSAQSIGGYTWQQSQAFEVAKDAFTGLNNDSGLLGVIIASNMMNGLGNGIMQTPENKNTFNKNNENGNNQQNLVGKDIYCSNCSRKFSSNLRFCPSCGDEYNPCSKCGTDNDKTAKRCVSCGNKLSSAQISCLNCNSVLDEGDEFCGNCGKSVNEDKCSRCGSILTAQSKFCPKCGQKNS